DKTDSQVSLYAATKKANESMAHSYSSIYGLRTTGLRFFTVYGPWGRPDMALFKFTKKMLNNEPIDIYNNGNLSRDFTYIDDIVNGISTLTASDIFDSKNINIFNVGNGSPIKLLDFVAELENTLKIKAKLNMMPMQLGDVSVTFADTSKLQLTTGYTPNIDIKQGVQRFVDWYKVYYKA
ncbi:MAG: UDP-glucuronate 4-epimerase, partial [Psychroserpens sp.]